MNTSLDVGAEVPATMVPTMHRVAGRRTEIRPDPAAGIDEVVTVELEPVAEALGPFEPGQFAMIWAPGVGEVPISVSTVDGGRLGLTIRSVGATTAKLCASPVGSELGLRGPFGRGWTLPQAGKQSIVVSGGIGLAPLRLHIEALVESRRELADPKLVLIIGARTPAEILYPELIDEWGEICEVHVTVDRAAPGWHGEVGLVTSTLSRLDVDADATAALCGPEIMMRLAGADVVAAGAPAAGVEVSMERSMACAVAHCGRCQIGPVLVCRDGPVFAWPEASPLMEVRRW